MCLESSRYYPTEESLIGDHRKSTKENYIREFAVSRLKTLLLGFHKNQKIIIMLYRVNNLCMMNSISENSIN